MQAFVVDARRIRRARREHAESLSRLPTDANVNRVANSPGAAHRLRERLCFLGRMSFRLDNCGRYQYHSRRNFTSTRKDMPEAQARPFHPIVEVLMPTSGTHITIIELMALDPRFSEILGDPNAGPDDPESLQMRYAKLGAVGPDIFYGLMDYGRDLQDFTNFACKTAGSFECIADLTAQLEDFTARVEADLTFGISTTAKALVAEFEGLFGLVSSFINEGLMALAVDRGVNFFPVFEARRQQDLPRETWFWADYLHYVKTGEFVQKLFEESRGDANLRAFAYGYLSHYVTDIVGHPFVNQVVGAPWRMYWQRHHLVENFIDANVWDRWHDSVPPPEPPSTEEAPLDTIRSTPHTGIGEGAPFTYARLNDHINIGHLEGSDPIDALIASICDKIKKGLANVGVAEPDPELPSSGAFRAWSEMVVRALRRAYDPDPPHNLRPDGYPSSDDVASAYMVFRLLLRFSTEEKLQQPEFPNVAADVWKAMKKVLDDLSANLGVITPPPNIGIEPGGQVTFEAIWQTMLNWVKWEVKTAIALANAAFQFLKDAMAVGGVALLDSVKIALYFVKDPLFRIFKAFRYYLVRAGYSVPYTDELLSETGPGVHGTTLWSIPTEPAAFPLEEIPQVERVKFPSHYPPWVPPQLLAEMQPPNVRVAEQPLTWPGPYLRGARPDAFIEAPLGQRDMLSPSGPVDLNNPPGSGGLPDDFGGAVANCRAAFEYVMQAEEAGELPEFPDYNLDGDRGYAWPCWDLRDPVNEHLDPSSGQKHPVDPVLIEEPHEQL